MRIPQIILVFFLYGLSFFTMGVVIMEEVVHCSDTRLRQALRFLAVFGLLHGFHEWLEMFENLGQFPTLQNISIPWENVRIAILALSFLPLSTFGITLLVLNPHNRRLTLLVPLGLSAVWGFGVLIFIGKYTVETSLYYVLEDWTRYVLALPGVVLACAGLIFQQREFRRAGMAQFGRDSLWAAIAFAWYGLVGQMFVTPSPLWPATLINTNLFYQVFGFPIQIVRAGSAIVASIFVIRFLRAFQVETQHKIEELQSARLEEARRREVLRGELLRRVVAAQEAERQRIARELHDSTGQSLTALGLGLRGAATALHQDPDKATNNLRQLERLVGDSIDELQRIIGDLRPSHLDDLGLAAALRWYCHHLEDRTGLPIQIEVQGEEPSLSPELTTAIFRMAQEALTNVVRHAHARSAMVRLCFRDEDTYLVVDDDGIGFDQASLSDSNYPAWGLLGMEERASLLGGSFSIYSYPGRGTRVEALIPYEQSEVKDEHSSTARG